MSTTKTVTFTTECKNNCGLLALPVPAYRLEEDNSGDRWVRCKECGTINRAYQNYE